MWRCAKCYNICMFSRWDGVCFRCETPKRGALVVIAYWFYIHDVIEGGALIKWDECIITYFPDALTPWLNHRTDRDIVISYRSDSALPIRATGQHICKLIHKSYFNWFYYIKLRLFSLCILFFLALQFFLKSSRNNNILFSHASDCLGKLVLLWQLVL